jgi:hypothetical protein
VVWNDGSLDVLESQADEMVNRGQLALRPTSQPRL